MKKLHLILGAVAALALSRIPASAQSYTDAALVISGTVPASDTLTTGTSVGIINTSRWDNVALQPTFAIAEAGTANVVFNFAKSVDGVTWEAAPSISGTIAATGATTTSGVINVATGAVGYIKLISIVNSNTSAIVNPSILYSRKPGH